MKSVQALPDPLPAKAAAQASQLLAVSERSQLLHRGYDEYCRRLEQGQAVDIDQFCAEFCTGYPSTVLRSLRLLLQAHEALAEHLPLEEESAALPLEDWPQPGEHFHGFILGPQLGRGSFARVYLASEPALGGRLVVVKLSRLGAREACIQGRLLHPNIVPIHSVQHDEASGLTILCMPYLGSATLQDVLAQGVASGQLPASARLILDVARAAVPAAVPQTALSSAPAVLQRGTYVEGVLYLGAQLADALEALHDLGICHQDLKPANVLLSPDGRPFLLDFNLSQDAQQTSDHVGGTLPYMAPEQLQALLRRRQQGDASPALPGSPADIFSLGVLLYELLTGQLPFGPPPAVDAAPEALQAFWQRQQQGPRPLRTLQPSVEPRLAALIERCLAANPQDRPSAAQLAQACRQLLSPLARAARWCRRRKLTVALGLASILLLALAGIGATLLREKPALLHYRLGVEAYQQTRYPEAIYHFTQALADEPERPQLWYARGRAYQALGNPEALHQALADYVHALEQKPSGDIHASIAYCYSLLGEYQFALFNYQKALDMGFVSAEVYNNLAYCYLRRGKLKEARQLLDQALHLNPCLQAAYHNRLFLAWRESLTRLRPLLDARKEHAAGMQPLRQDMDWRLKQALQDMSLALALGPASGELYRDAACICALGAWYDPRWRDPCLEFCVKAIQNRCDMTTLINDPIFLSLGNNLQNLAPQSGPAAEEKTNRLADPGAGLARVLN